jgi:O-antigen/teichoic acid export membrane protein
MRASPPPAPASANERPLVRVAKNAGALLGAYVVPRALTFAAALLAARVLQPAAFGAYGAAAALAMTLSVLCTLGMLPLLVRELARDPTRGDALIAAANRIKIIAALPMLAALLLVATVIGLSADATRAALVLAIGHVFWALAESYGARLQAEERMRRWLEANIVFGVCSAFLGGIAVYMTRSVPWFCAGFAAGQLFAFLYLRLRTPLRRVPARARAGELTYLLRAVAPFAVAFFVLTVFYKLDILLLSALSDASSAGLYAAGYKLVDVVHALAVVAAAAVYPRLARAKGTAAASRATELFFLAAVPGAALLWLSREPLVSLLFGADYAGTSYALALLAPATALLAVNILAGYLLASANRAGTMAAVYAVALPVKVVCGVLWMPSSGAAGAAAAMLAGEAVAIVGFGLVLVRLSVPLPRLRPLLLGGAAALVAALSAPIGSTLIAASIFTIATAVVYGAGGALSTQERRELRSLVARRARLRMPEPT